MSRKLAGCYYCLAVFPLSEVKEYVDDGATPLCPRCGIDAVLDGVNCGVALRRYHKKMFGELKR